MSSSSSSSSTTTTTTSTDTVVGSSVPFPPSVSPSKPLKLMYLDTLSTKGLVFSAILFFAALFIMVIIGANGPVAGKTVEYPLSSLCNDVQNCTVSLQMTLPDLSPFNQATWFTARIQRPRLISTKQPVLPSSSFKYVQMYYTDVIADGQSLVTNAPHSVEINCLPENDVCTGMLIFAAAHIYYTKYTVKVTFVNPLLPYAQIGSDLSPTVGITLRHGYISDDYTLFEIGWKVFFLVITAVILIAYIVRQITGPGSRNELREIIPSTTEQKWIIALGVLLFFYNDPTFPTYISKPSLVFSGFYAVCSFTFIATILLYWLVLFDLARLQGEVGIHVSIDSLPPHQRPGACFWVPKILLVCTIWTIAIASYMYTRIMQLENPTFSIFESVGTQVVQWFGTFVAGLGGVYVLYIFALIVLGCRQIKHMRPSSRFLIILTITALIVILIGLFLNSYTALRETSAAFLSAAGVANIYVWTLMLLHLPVANPNIKEGSVPLDENTMNNNGGNSSGDDNTTVEPKDVDIVFEGSSGTNEEEKNVDEYMPTVAPPLPVKRVPFSGTNTVTDPSTVANPSTTITETEDAINITVETSNDSQPDRRRRVSRIMESTNTVVNVPDDAPSVPSKTSPKQKEEGKPKKTQPSTQSSNKGDSIDDFFTFANDNEKNTNQQIPGVNRDDFGFDN